MSNEAFVVDLSKKFEVNLKKAGVVNIPILRTRLAGDRSGSMRHNFERGLFSRVVDLFIGAALKFDDNGELEVGFFNTAFTETPVALKSDAGRYMNTKASGVSANGGTYFHPVVNWTMEEDTREGAEKPSFFGRLKNVFTGQSQESALPDCGQYCGIITDGSLESQQAIDAFERSLRASPDDCFYQFIGIGGDVNKSYMTDVERRFKNVGFVYAEDPMHLSDDQFYELLCNKKFVDWVNAYTKARGIQ